MTKKAQPRICGIYKITNTIDGKVYIGQSVNIYQRWKNHKSAARDPHSPTHHLPLYCALREYGEENFTFEIIEQCNEDELNDEERKYIQEYQSDDSKHGYNDSQKDYRFPDRAKISRIMDLLRNSGLFMDEISMMCDQSFNTVRLINKGKSYHKQDMQYPLRSELDRKTIHRMRYKQCRPSIEYRENHSAGESYEEYKRICRQRNAAGEKIPIVFDEDIDVDFIGEILATSLFEVAEKYGYGDGTNVQRHLKNAGFPYKNADMKMYYEREKGIPHKTSPVSRKQKAFRTPRISRPIAQYDGETRELVDVFLTASEAARSVGAIPSNVINAAQNRARIKRCRGYFWRMIDINGDIICPEDYAEYYQTHQFACIACGAELPNNRDQNRAQCCNTCDVIKRVATTKEQLQDSEWLLKCLSKISDSALAIIYNVAPNTIHAYRKAADFTDEELATAREKVLQERRDAIRARVPKILPEGM